MVSAKVNKIKLRKEKEVLGDGSGGGNFRQASQRRSKQKGNISVRQVCGGGEGEPCRYLGKIFWAEEKII